jgi:hypothetical protein
MKHWLRVIVTAGTLMMLMLPGMAQTVKPGDKAGEKKDPPAQSSVATKKAFGTIAAKDPAVEKALAANDLPAIQKLVGKTGAFKGTVVKVFTSRNNSIVILNFAKNYKEAATAVLKPEHYAKFPNMQSLKDKTVLVTGKVISYQERPEIELTKPEQIKIIP